MEGKTREELLEEIKRLEKRVYELEKEKNEILDDTFVDKEK